MLKMVVLSILPWITWRKQPKPVKQKNRKK